MGIEYQGLKRVSRNDIADRIIKDRIRVREGDPLSRGELDRLKAAVEEIYREKGYRLAEASYTIEEVSPGDRRVFFSIDEGDKVRIAEIDFEGNTVYGDRRLQLTMKKTKEAGLLSRVLKKDVFNVATFEEDLDKMRNIYRKVGYKNVLLGEPQIEIKATKPERRDPRGAEAAPVHHRAGGGGRPLEAGRHHDRGQREVPRRAAAAAVREAARRLAALQGDR